LRRFWGACDSEKVCRQGIYSSANFDWPAANIAADSYDFEQKKLRAKHFKHPDPPMPKVFISELLVSQFSKELQDTVADLVSQVKPQVVAVDNFLHCGKPWQISFSTYRQLLAESEYAAWVGAFGFRPNHFTVSINHLKQFDCIDEVN
jgi:hypothetical protein